MTLREIVPSILRWWRRRGLLRQAPSPAEIERMKARLAERAKHHRERAHYRRALQNAVTARLAAEQGRQLRISK
jgi:hypothetical protein